MASENGRLSLTEATEAFDRASARLAAVSKSPDDRSWLLDGADLLAKPDPGPTAWLIDQMIVEGALVACVGKWKTMKTWVMLDLAISIATGRAAFGKYEIAHPGLVVYVIEESGEAALQRRLGALCRGRAIDPCELSGNLFISANRGVKLDDREWRRTLLATCDGIRPRLVVFDPLARMKEASRDENAQTEMASIIEFLRELRERSGSAVGFVHHTGHAGNQMRGSSDLESVWESRLGWERDANSPTITLTAQHREAEDTAAIKVRSCWNDEDQLDAIRHERRTRRKARNEPQLPAGDSRLPSGTASQRVHVARYQQGDRGKRLAG